MFTYMNTRRPENIFFNLNKIETGARLSEWVSVSLIPVFNLVTILLLSFLLSVPACYAETKTTASFLHKIHPYLKNGSALVVDQQGNELFAYNPDKKMVPASILKIATADAVLSELGEDYRIPTQFYLTADHYLAVKGYGDPSLVSESLTDIARQLKPILKKLNNTELKGIVMDSSFFRARQKINGQSNSNNPYDASIGALVVNYNTIYVHKSQQGKLSSAEPQTPLTPTVRKLARKIPYGKQRINLGNNEEQNLLYFAELLYYKLSEQGIAITTPLAIMHKPVPEGSIKLYTHYSRPLSEIIQQLLYYSNNLTANQLLLILGARQYGVPADLPKAQKALCNFLSRTIGLNDFSLNEGSGLSRQNRFTARQFIKILRHFEPYHYLLRAYDEKFLAKTGTLKGIATFAGYMISPQNNNIPFVIMLNQPERSNYRYKIAESLYEYLF